MPRRRPRVTTPAHNVRVFNKADARILLIDRKRDVLAFPSPAISVPRTSSTTDTSRDLA
jgi:hypothetical protein